MKNSLLVPEIDTIGNGLEMKNQVAIIVLTYNQELYLEQAVISVLLQKLERSLHLFIIDDASSDNTLKVATKLQLEYPKLITVISHKHNQFQNGNSPIFTIMELIQCDFFAFCDGDDYWIDAHKLQKQIDIFETDAQVALVHTSYLEENYIDDQIQLASRRERDIKKARRVKRALDLVHGNDIKHSTVSIRRSAIFFKFLHGAYGIRANDWLLYLSATHKGSIEYLDAETTVHRLFTNGTWNGETRGSKDRMKEEVRWYAAAKVENHELKRAFQKRVVEDEMRQLIRESWLLRLPLLIYRGLRLVIKNMLIHRVKV
jgi:glycosyltransferase involved in cell wall biosynthesis